MAEIVRGHWREFGRTYYSRHDYEALDSEAAGRLVADLRVKLPSLAGQRLGQETVGQADDFAYTDPVDGSVARGQGIRLLFESGARNGRCRNRFGQVTSASWGSI